MKDGTKSPRATRFQGRKENALGSQEKQKNISRVGRTKRTRRSDTGKEEKQD